MGLSGRRERKADGEKGKGNTDNSDHCNAFEYEITSLVAFL